MPTVTAGEVNIEYQLGLVRDGHIQHFAGYLPGDNDTPIPAVFTKIKPGKSVSGGGLSIHAVPYVPNGSLPEKYAEDKRIPVHLCKNSGECTAGKQGSLHVAEWAWLAEEEEGEGSPLMCCLGAAKKEAANPGPPPGLKPPQRFDIFTPQKKLESQPGGEIAQWCDKHGVPEAVDALTYNGLRAIAEVAVLSDAQVDAICAGLSYGSCSRLKLAVQALRQTISNNQAPGGEEPGSGWVDARSGHELPMSLMRGKEAGGPELLISADQCVAFVQLPEGWVEVQKRPESQAFGAAPSGAAPPGYPLPDRYAPMYSTPGFGSAGPLEEFASTARTLLRQVGGSEAAAQNLAPSTLTTGAAMPSGPGVENRTYCAPRTGTSPGLSPLLRTVSPPGSNVVPQHGSGRVLAPAVPRAPAQPVSLKVLSLQGASIVEEWTDSGTIRFKTAVANRCWKKTEAQDSAAFIARFLDVAKDSGLDIAHDPAFEVPLRELAARWYADQHPSDKETADFLRESSTSLDGIPRGMWLEAKDYRKLTSRTKSSD